jgi:hypothetical protein
MSWPEKTYHLENAKDPSSPIEMDLSAFKASKTAGGATTHEWHDATNMKSKGAASWCTVTFGETDGDLERDGAARTGIMYSQRQMSGFEMPKADDKVFVYFPEDAEAAADLERGEGTIKLIPVTTDALYKSRSAMRDIADADEDEDEDLERKMLFPMAAAAAGAALLWAPYGAMMAASIYPAFYAGLMDKDLEAQIEVDRAKAIKKHSVVLRATKSDGKSVTFKNPAEFERKMLLPFLAAPLFFYPWGLAIGTAYYCAFTGALGAAVPIFFPWAEWWKKDHTGLFKDMGTTAANWVKTGWPTFFFGYWATWWWWSWVFYAIYWQPAIANFWFSVYKYWYDYWVKAMGSGGFFPGFWSTVTGAAGKAFGTGTIPMPSPTPAPTAASAEVALVELKKPEPAAVKAA